MGNQTGDLIFDMLSMVRVRRFVGRFGRKVTFIEVNIGFEIEGDIDIDIRIGEGRGGVIYN